VATQISRVGNSVTVEIPEELLRKARLSVGDRRVDADWRRQFWRCMRRAMLCAEVERATRSGCLPKLRLVSPHVKRQNCFRGKGR